jgi:hypothetical protein
MADELSDVAKAHKDLLWGMYTDVRAHARHAEALRSNVVNFMILVASVLIAVISNDRRINRADIALCLAVALIGLIGLAFAASYTELHERNRKRAMRLRRALDEEFFANSTHTIAALLEEADVPHEDGRLYRWGRRLAGSTQRFWFVLPGLTLLSGLVLCIVAI